MDEGKKVVVVDEDTTYLELAQDVLEAGGFRVIASRPALGLRDMIRREVPNLILVDVVGLGAVVADVLARSSSCPVYLLAQDDQLGEERVRFSGAAGFIHKSARAIGLVDIIRLTMQVKGATCPSRPWSSYARNIKKMQNSGSTKPFGVG
jgi:DNA-binding NtrC family response regulator